MEIRNLNKYITANLISLLGYAGLGFLFLYKFVIMPEGTAYNLSNGISSQDDFGSSIVFVGFWAVYTIIFLIIVILGFVEYFLRKKYYSNLFSNITLPEFLKVLYSLIFWIGILLSIMPLYLFIYILLTFIISSF